MKSQPKDPRGSIRAKYNRRLISLSFMVDDFLLHAKERLDPSRTGKIYKRAEIEAVVEKCEELRKLLPTPADEPSSNVLNWPGIDEVLEDASDQTKTICKEGEDFLKNLSAEDWEELRNFAAKKNR